MNENFEIDQVLRLVKKLSSSPVTGSRHLAGAVRDFIGELYATEQFSFTKHRELIKYLNAEFFIKDWLSGLDTITIDDFQRRAIKAVELVKQFMKAVDLDDELDIKCDMTVFINHLQREIKEAAAQNIELEFYLHWFGQLIFEVYPVFEERCQ